MLRRVQPLYFFLAVCLVLTYIALLIWFHRVDFYRNHFFETGLSVTRYQGARLAFACFLAWTIYATGAGLNGVIFGRTALRSLPAWERLPLFFVVGAGALQLLLFDLGLAGFVNKPVAVALAVGIMVASLPHLAHCLQELAKGVSKAVRGWLQYRAIPSAIAVLATGAATMAFIAVKGLYPAGGHDYYNHYFPFYKRVVETGSILPNDVWYQFYYSKGAGLYFLSMLLTDALAPQLVTSTFIACGAGIVWALLKRAGSNSLVPWIGIFLYIALLIYTPGPIENHRHGGWADLEKIHELTSVLCLAVVWIVYRLADAEGRITRIWGFALQMAVAGIAILTPALVLLIGAFLLFYLLYLSVRGGRENTLWLFAGCATGGVCLLATALINYHLTGIPLDQLLVQLWPYVDLQRVSRWGTLFEVLLHHRGLTALSMQASDWSWAFLPLLATYLRLELWWPIILAALPLIAFQFGSQSRREALLRRFQPHLWVALCGFASMVVLVALFGGGRSQPISFYRLSSFSYAPMLCAALCLWHLVLGAQGFEKRRLDPLLAVALVATIPIWILLGKRVSVRWHTSDLLAIGTNATRLTTGKFSLKEAYQNQQGWPGRQPWGGIYPGVVTPWMLLPAQTPIWSFHLSSYCMLPDCEMRSSKSFRFSPSWQIIFFGAADDAKRKLQDEGLDYFFFSSELGTDDLVPAAPIFSVDQIADHLAIRWTDGTSYLLTWKGADTERLTPEFLAAYRKTVKESPFYHQFLSVDWRAISDYITSQKDDLKPFNLPWCTNCQGMLPTYKNSHQRQQTKAGGGILPIQKIRSPFSNQATAGGLT